MRTLPPPPPFSVFKIAGFVPCICRAKIGRNLLSFCSFFKEIAPGIYLENGLDGPMAHQVQKTWAGGMGAALGPHWVQGNALVGGSGGRSPPRKYGFLGILKVISCLILMHISPPIWQGIQ